MARVLTDRMACTKLLLALALLVCAAVMEGYTADEPKFNLDPATQLLNGGQKLDLGQLKLSAKQGVGRPGSGPLLGWLRLVEGWQLPGDLEPPLGHKGAPLPGPQAGSASAPSVPPTLARWTTPAHPTPAPSASSCRALASPAACPPAP